MSEKSIIVLGAGGHAKVVIDALLAGSARIAGITDRDPQTHGQTVLGVPVLGDDDVLKKYNKDEVYLVNALGSLDVAGAKRRQRIFQEFKNQGYRFVAVVHPSAVLGLGVKVGEGAVIMAGSVIQADSQIGDNTIVNTGVCIDHDSRIGPSCHIAPGCVLSGGVTIGECSHVGTGAAVIQNISIGRESVVAAGAVVVKNVPERSTVRGVPARSV